MSNWNPEARCSRHSQPDRKTSWIARTAILSTAGSAAISPTNSWPPCTSMAPTGSSAPRRETTGTKFVCARRPIRFRCCTRRKTGCWATRRRSFRCLTTASLAGKCSPAASSGSWCISWKNISTSGSLAQRYTGAGTTRRIMSSWPSMPPGAMRPSPNPSLNGVQRFAGRRR